MGGGSSHHHYHVDQAATEAARQAEEAANRARETYLQSQRAILQQAQENERRAAEEAARREARAREAERQAREAAEARRLAEERRDAEQAAAAAALEQERIAAAARLAAEQEAAAAALERERIAAAARLEETRVEAERQAEIARREAIEQAEEARRDAIRQERIRAHEERQREWAELNRDYPIPDHLEGFVTGILDDVDEDAAADRFVNIGIIGESGTGKSSLIRELVKQFGSGQDEEPLISFESDGTLAPTSYVVPGFDGKVRLWDLPGQGTERFPSVSYLRDMGLKYFDALLIATDGRWKTNDSTLLDAIRFAGIWFKVVRTKIDLAVESGAYDHGMSQEMALEQARAGLQEQLISVTDPGVIHLVTTRRNFWVGAHGGTPYGLVSTLCDEVTQYIENRADELHTTVPMGEVVTNQDDDFEVVSNINFEVAAEQAHPVSSANSAISVRS